MGSIKITLLKANPDRELPTNGHERPLRPSFECGMLEITTFVENMRRVLCRSSKSCAQESCEESNVLEKHLESDGLAQTGQEMVREKLLKHSIQAQVHDEISYGACSGVGRLLRDLCVLVWDFRRRSRSYHVMLHKP